MGEPSVTLEDKVAFLGDPRSYPEPTTSVVVRETHMSFVFLTDTLVYKLKKPVRYPYLDFMTVWKRHAACTAEVRLNRRLAGAAYRRVVPLRRGEEGRLSIGGNGAVVDWLVEIVRLDERFMLDARIVAGTLAPHHLEALSTRLQAFYVHARPQIEDGGAYPRHLVEEQRVNRAVLQRFAPGLGPSLARLLDVCEQSLESGLPEIETRIGAGFIVEGHGDLRPEHVHLGEKPIVIDCLEFNRAMRIIDPYDEVNYLGLECAMLGDVRVRPLLLAGLRDALGHPPSARLMATYGLFRALLRARLSIAHLTESDVRTPRKWRPLARRYLAAAEQEAISLPCPEDPRSIRCRREAGSSRRGGGRGAGS